MIYQEEELRNLSMEEAFDRFHRDYGSVDPEAFSSPEEFKKFFDEKYKNLEKLLSVFGKSPNTENNDTRNESVPRRIGKLNYEHFKEG